MRKIEDRGRRGMADEAGKYDIANYAFVPATASEMAEYRRLIEAAYGPLGFINDHAECFLPREGTVCYVLVYRDRIVGSCSLTPVGEADSVYHRYVPVDGAAERAGMIELNNIILVPELRGGIGLSLILYNSVVTALARGAGVVVGITRYQTLRYFVEAGAIPVAHDPLHLLGRADLNDFIIYYDVQSKEAQVYLRERARRLFGQTAVLGEIRRRLQRDGDESGGREPPPAIASLQAGRADGAAARPAL